MRKYILVYNPVAGDAYFKNKLDAVIDAMQQQRCVVLPIRAVCREETREFLELAEQIKPDGIIAAGGDGTVHEVVNAMLESNLNVPLGIIPCGTSNDFATYLGICDDIDSCIDVVVRGVTRRVDVGRVNGKYFINVACAGMLTSVAHNVDTALKNTVGRIAYYLKGLGELPNFRAMRVRIQADDWKMEDDILLFLAMNSGTVGSFTNVLPVAAIDDGMLDLLVVTKCTPAELVKLLIRYFTGNGASHKNVIHVRAKNIYIESDDSLESDLDGERGPELPLNITVAPHAIRIFC